MELFSLSRSLQSSQRLRSDRRSFTAETYVSVLPVVSAWHSIRVFNFPLKKSSVVKKVRASGYSRIQTLFWTVIQTDFSLLAAIMPSYASILALTFAVSFVNAATPPSDANSQNEPAETGRFVRSNVVELNTVGYLMPHHNQQRK